MISGFAFDGESDWKVKVGHGLYLIKDECVHYVSYFHMHLILSLLYIFKVSQPPTCTTRETLVSGANPVPDAQLTSSSMWNDWHGPRHARINVVSGSGGWLCSDEERLAQTPSMYLQVSLY